MRTRAVLAPICVCLAAATLVATISLGSATAATPSSGVPAGGTRVTGGTVTWAEPPSAVPNFIYPFMPSTVYSAANINELQHLLYRPLYAFGVTKYPTLDPAQSLASRARFNSIDRTVKITLKSWRWSDGEKLSTADVMLWLNILHAEKSNWAPYLPGVGMPDDVTSVTVTSPSKLVMRTAGPVNGRWYRYNMLSQIVPLPEAWDVTHVGAPAGSGGCARGRYGAPSTDAACRAVWNFMAGQAGYDSASGQVSPAVYASYATNPLWQVVDGPWRLTAFDGDGRATFVPNRRYSGRVKPKISEFVEEPFASSSAEVDALKSGAVTVGYLPLADVTNATRKPTQPGPNLAELAGRYYLVPFYAWSINYFPYNFDSTGDDGNAAKIFHQLYFRQAFQLLVDQNRIIKKTDKGYGVPTYGPVPVFPKNADRSGLEASNPYRHDRKKAMKLLAQNGWRVVPNGVDTCVVPGTGSGQCGPGIRSGARLAFDLQYASGNSTLAATLASEQSSWASAGIEITLSPAPPATVGHDATACAAGPRCSWEFEDSGTGHTFAPDYDPTGEALFETGTKANIGSYSDPINDNLTQQTNYTGAQLLYYQNYLAQQLPVVFQSSPVTYLWEVADDLRGIAPLNPAGYQDPETYFFVK